MTKTGGRPPSAAASEHLQPGMGVELVEEVHEQVNLQGADTQHHVLLRLGSVAAVVPSQLLALHPQVGQLLELSKPPECRQAEAITPIARRARSKVGPAPAAGAPPARRR